MERPSAHSIPDVPGSYQFYDRHGRVIYVGKARSLRSRITSYFTSVRGQHPRTTQMVASAERVEWIQVRNDVEALMLEYSLIKEHRPRFNVRLVDDKSYPLLAINLADTWPRPRVMRGKRRKGVKYFGPYAHAYAIRETLDLLLRTFPVRTCTDRKLDNHRRLGRPCLLFHIEKCSAPCVGEIDEVTYGELVTDLVSFLEGDTEPIVEKLRAQMSKAAKAENFELAARFRDRLAAIRKVIESQQMVAERTENFDTIGVSQDQLEAAVQVFFVRRGRVVGRKGFILDKVLAPTDAELSERILEELYYEPPPAGYPKSVLMPEMPEDLDLYQRWLTDARGSRVELRVPKKGAKKRLLETVTTNAAEELLRHRLKRATDHNSRSRALTELQEHLELPEAPLRIECYDMSHIQGSDYVGSMVVLEDGLPAKRQYRRFKIQGVDGNDDFAAMEEVLTRRFEAYLSEREKPIDATTKFAYPPQLVLVDGGKGQLSVATRVLAKLGLDGEIPAAALAKRFEEVFVGDSDLPIEIPRTSEALFMLQRIRDESHRFAVDYHRKLRTRRMTKSALDDVPGLGPARRKRLLEEFGGIKNVQAASIDTLKELSWLPDSVAASLWESLHGQ